VVLNEANDAVLLGERSQFLMVRKGLHCRLSNKNVKLAFESVFADVVVGVLRTTSILSFP
jgi:hypothetical protein